MGLHNKGAVVAGCADRITQQRVNVERVGLAGLVRHLGRSLVHIYRVSAAVGEAHRHAGTRKHARHIVHPIRWPVVVAGVQPYPVFSLDDRLAVVITPSDAMHPMGLGRRQTRELRRQRSKQSCVLQIKLGGRKVGTSRIRVRVQTYLKPLRSIGCHLGISERIRGQRLWEDIRRGAHALPIGHGTSRRAGSQ